jgi:thiol-disulfide isomerase/thioredoxin
LPTESEWEYCCRAGTKTPFHFGNTISTDQANYHGNYTYGDGQKGVYRQRTTPVDSFPANAWGLHDMHGNVLQLCQDWFGPYPQKDVVDPTGPEKGQLRVVRGGWWSAPPCRSAQRGAERPGERRYAIGLRVCFGVDGPATANPVGARDERKANARASAVLLSKNEELADNDEKDTRAELKNSPRKVYKIKLLEGKTYQIDLTSQDFDALLRLEDRAGKEITGNNDFEPGSLDSRIAHTIDKTGEYRIIATCLDGKTGKFKLTVVETSAVAAAQGPAASLFKAGQAIALTLKDGKARYTGELTEDDTACTSGYFKVFSIKLEAGNTYRIDYREAGYNPKVLDPLLFLEDAQGKVLAKDDDSGGGLNARVVYKAPSTGIYRLIATTANTNQIGKFSVEVSGTAADEKLAHLMELLADYTKSPAAQQKKIVAEATRYFQSKGAGLSAAEAQLALQLANRLEQGDPDLARSTYKSLAKAFAAASNPQIAFVARQFEGSLKQLEMIGKEMLVAGKTVDGKDFDLKSLKGKVVLVDFWATWCGPCIAEMPNIERAYDRYHGKGFEVIGVSLDRSAADITRFAEARTMKWTSINIEDSKALADRYGVNAIPFPVLVDQAGKVVSTRARGPELDRLLERLLDGKGQ